MFRGGRCPLWSLGASVHEYRAMLSSSSLHRRNLLPFLTQIKILLSINIQPISTVPNPNPQPTSDLTPSSICDTLTSYSNDWKRALDFFHWVETQCSFTHTTDTYNRMIDVLGKFFEFDLCWKLIHQMRNSPASFPNHETFRSLFNRYASAHMANDAVEAFQKLDGFNLRDEVSYYNLINALCKNKHVIEAQELLCNKEGDLDLGIRVCDTKIHNMILRGWYKMGWWSRCREYWIEMDEKGVEKDLLSYSTYMDIVCRGGKPWKTVKLYKEMKSKGMKLDVAAYNTVIRAIGLSQGVDFSVRILREMKELGCKPTIVTYNTIIKLLCENGRFREARQLYDEMPKMGCKHNAFTYHCFFATLEKPIEIMGLFNGMMRSGVPPRNDTFVMLMRKFGRWGYLRLVLLVWEKMGEVNCSPDEHAYNALIDALVEKGMVDMGRKYEQEMCERGLSPKPRRRLIANVDEE